MSDTNAFVTVRTADSHHAPGEGNHQEEDSHQEEGNHQEEDSRRDSQGEGRTSTNHETLAHRRPDSDHRVR